ncbi:Piso0_000682 [Millerozyma farinosa CBS 7064]|uniref:Piso0_000682 protein n=1 Tax=Pichia sorbitophila (strain ATCC MYA-4447 / BCRC 22081 / CBS 7064 / NBRC 10061 / NRRL Y-12695) TaxID=559304 RepID=G8YR82_PICSO|nr:Piso0_000682 [Millerozyma farinosa CBS 7064]
MIENIIKVKEKPSLKLTGELTSSAFTVGLVAALGGFMYGYDTGLINNILEMDYVQRHVSTNKVDFTVDERSLLTAVLSLGTFFGALFAPVISDQYGRKFSIIISSAFIFNVGNVLQSAASEKTLLCVGRAVSGLAVGILSAIVPLYQAEASPRWVRGSVVYTYQWAITWGLLIASAVCQGTKNLNNSGSYRVPIGIQFLWSLLLWLGMVFLPESPRYYVQKDKIQDALESLSRLRKLPTSDNNLIEELVEIKANYDYELSFGKASYIDCFRSGGGRHKQFLRMLTGIGVQAFQQGSGINFIFYYGVNFFKNTSVKNSYLVSFLTYAVNVIFTIPGLILVDVIGRRKLLISGGIGMTISNFIIAIIGVTLNNNKVRAAINVSFSCLFIAFFASSWGGGVWAVTSDIYGIGIRQKAISMNAATNWLVNFCLALATAYLIDTTGKRSVQGTKIFFIWGSLNAAGVVFVYLLLYETKGLKLEEVDLMYKTCKSARDSTNFQPTKLVSDVATSLAELGYRYSSMNLDISKSNENQGAHESGGLYDGSDSYHNFLNSDISEDTDAIDSSRVQKNELNNTLDKNNITLVPYSHVSCAVSINSDSDESDNSRNSDTVTSSGPASLGNYPRNLSDSQRTDEKFHQEVSYYSSSLPDGLTPIDAYLNSEARSPSRLVSGHIPSYNADPNGTQSASAYFNAPSTSSSSVSSTSSFASQRPSDRATGDRDI